MKPRWRILIIIAAAAIFLAALIYSIVLRFTKKSTAELYIAAEKKAFSEMAENIEKQYVAFMNKQKPFMETVNSSRTEFTANITGGAESFGLDDAGAISGILKKSKLITETKRNPDKGISAVRADLLIEKAPFINAQLFSDRDSAWLSVPDILPDRYFSIRWDTLDELYERFSIPVRPMKLVSGREIAARLSFDGASFMESAGKLGDIYVGYLTEETIIDNGVRTIPIGESQTECSEILVMLDEEKASALLRELLTAISDDEVLLQYTYSNFANISELLDDAGLFRLFGFLDDNGIIMLNDYERELLGKFNVRNDIDGFREKLKKTAASYRLRDGLKMKVKLDRNGDLLLREVHLDFWNIAGGDSFKADIRAGGGSDASDGGKYMLAGITVEEYSSGTGSSSDNGSGSNTGTGSSSDTGLVSNSGNSSGSSSDSNAGAGKGDGSGGSSVTGEGNSSGNSSGRITELLITSSNNGTEGKQTEESIEIMYAVTPAGGVKSEVDISIDISGRTDEKTLKRLSSINFLATVSGDFGEGRIKAEIENTAWENKKLNKSNSTTDIKVDADLPFLGINGFSASAGIANEDSFGIDDFQLPDFEKAVVTDIYAASDEDLEKLEMEIMASFGVFYLNNKYIFDALLGWG